MKRNLIAASLAGAFSVASAAAFAGECPANQRVADGKGQKMVTHGAKGVSDTVRATTDLAKESVALNGRQFRLRELVIQPGGIVPWHSHDDRPAMIYIVSGEVIEYASNCSVPIVHKPGDVAPEAKGTSHWWENKGKSVVKLISVDLFPVADKKLEKMM